MQLFPLKSTKSEEVVPCLIRMMNRMEGVGDVFYTDDAACFRSKLCEAFLTAHKLTHRLVLPLHHNANGLVEHEGFETCRVMRKNDSGKCQIEPEGLAEFFWSNVNGSATVPRGSGERDSARVRYCFRGLISER